MPTRRHRVQVVRASAALTAALLLACTEKAPAPAGAQPEAINDPSLVKQGVPLREAGSTRRMGPDGKRLLDAPSVATTGTIELEMSRSDFKDLVGDCLDRIHFRAGGGGALTTEVFQPVNKKCSDRFGEQRVVIQDLKVKQLLPGLETPPPPPDPKARGIAEHEPPKMEVAPAVK
jgi:hypothetical protein